MEMRKNGSPGSGRGGWTAALANRVRAGDLQESALYVAARKRVSRLLVNALVYALLVEFVFVFVFPYLYMVINSLKYDFDIRSANTQWIITRFNFYNYSQAISDLRYVEGLLNNLMAAFGSTLGHVASASLIAYGLARFRFPGRNLVFSIVILTLIIPPNLLLIPMYIQFARMGQALGTSLIGTLWPILLPTFFGFGLKGGLFIFIFRQYFKGLPASYEEAAKIEGCGPLRIFLTIILPLSKTGVLVVAILSTMWHWNDYFEPIIYLKGPSTLLFQRIVNIQVWRGVYTAAGNYINPVVLAACVLITAPLLLIYFVFQKQFMKGIEFTGLAN